MVGLVVFTSAVIIAGDTEHDRAIANDVRPFLETMATVGNLFTGNEKPPDRNILLKTNLVWT